MDYGAPITWLINEINQIVSTGASSAASGVASAVTPLVASCFGIYIILITMNYMRGAESEPVLDFFTRIAGFAVVIGMGLNASTYTSMVVPIVTGLGSDLANAVTGGNVNATVLDQLANHYFKILEEGYDKANSPIFPMNIGPLLLYAFKAVLLLVGLIPFLVAAAMCLIVADVGSVLVAMLGPLYFGCLLFPATRQYFSAWVNTAFSYALIPVLVAVISTVSVGLSKKMLETGGNLSDTSLHVVFFAALGNLILIFLIRQVASMASSLSAGGINAAVPGGLGSAAMAIRSGTYGAMRDIKTLNKGYAALQKRRGGGGGGSGGGSMRKTG